MQKSRRAYIFITALYFFLVAGISIYSVFFYESTLPAVRLIWPEKGTVQYICEKTAEAKDLGGGKYQVALTFPPRYLLPKVFAMGMSVSGQAEGQPFTGKISGTTEDPVLGSEILVQFESKLDLAGKPVTLHLESEPKTYENVVPKSAVQFNSENDITVAAVRPKEGAWGTDYVVTQEQVMVWPMDSESETVLLLTAPDDAPIIESNDPALFTSTPVQLIP